MQREDRSFDRSPTLVMAVGTGLAIANIYYAQPVLNLIGNSFGSERRLVNLVPTATQLGYAAGILLLVPLSDRIDRKRLIVWQCAGLLVALIAAASSASAVALLIASVVIGLFATIAQQIVPFAALLSLPERRGRTVGTVMSGLLCGILLSRTLSGLVGAHLGWRATFWMGAASAGIMGALLGWRLPRSRPATNAPYSVLLASLVTLFRRERVLRRAALTQGLLFAGFSAFWSVLALLFAQPKYGLGSDVAGLFGILAVAGVFIAPAAGRHADTGGPEKVVALGAAIVIAAFALMAIHAGLLAIAVGVILMDAGVQMAMIGNQAIVYARAGDAAGRYNTVFIATMFVCGSLGSASATIAWSIASWPGVMLLGTAYAVVALFLQYTSRRMSTIREALP